MRRLQIQERALGFKGLVLGQSQLPLAQVRPREILGPLRLPGPWRQTPERKTRLQLQPSTSTRRKRLPFRRDSPASTLTSPYRSNIGTTASTPLQLKLATVGCAFPAVLVVIFTIGRPASKRWAPGWNKFIARGHNPFNPDLIKLVEGRRRLQSSLTPQTARGGWALPLIICANGISTRLSRSV